MIRTIHIDIEGGWGGSSRSLFELLSRLDRSRIQPLVLHRQQGPIVARYSEIGIPTLHVPEVFSFAPRPRNSLKIFLAKLPALRHMGRALDAVCRAAEQHQADLIHLNYEGLFLMAGPLKRRLGLPLVCHSRTHIPTNAWGSWVVSSLRRHVDQMFFITPQEESRFRSLERGQPIPGSVMWNIVQETPPSAQRQPPCAVYLGNLDSAKGPDRLIDVALHLHEMKAPPLLIEVYGAARSDPKYRDDMQDRIDALALHDRIRLCGHTSQPEQVISGALALLRPSRTNDPWGRDVIEAVTAGVPVLATGDFEGVVANGKTGFLFDPFDAAAMARDLVRLVAEPDLRTRLSEAGRALLPRHDGTQQTAIFHAAAERLTEAAS